jgi:3,4-dihydroxyphenylacetate 2,3-dioxygenase
VPLHFMSRAHQMKVVSIAAWCTVHSHDESRMVGRGDPQGGRGVGQQGAAGRLRLPVAQDLAEPDYAANNGTFTISSEFNRQVDLHVLDMWQRGDHATFLKMLPEYAQFCCGEGSMHDTAMLYGALAGTATPRNARS